MPLSKSSKMRKGAAVKEKLIGRPNDPWAPSRPEPILVQFPGLALLYFVYLHYRHCRHCSVRLFVHRVLAADDPSRSCTESARSFMGCPVVDPSISIDVHWTASACHSSPSSATRSYRETVVRYFFLSCDQIKGAGEEGIQKCPAAIDCGQSGLRTPCVSSRQGLCPPAVGPLPPCASEKRKLHQRNR
jgi:hypothetical protein